MTRPLLASCERLFLLSCNLCNKIKFSPQSETLWLVYPLECASVRKEHFGAIRGWSVGFWFCVCVQVGVCICVSMCVHVSVCAALLSDSCWYSTAPWREGRKVVCEVPLPWFRIWLGHAFAHLYRLVVWNTSLRKMRPQIKICRRMTTQGETQELSIPGDCSEASLTALEEI